MPASQKIPKVTGHRFGVLAQQNEMMLCCISQHQRIRLMQDTSFNSRENVYVRLLLAQPPYNPAVKVFVREKAD